MKAEQSGCRRLAVHEEDGGFGTLAGTPNLRRHISRAEAP